MQKDRVSSQMPRITEDDDMICKPAEAPIVNNAHEYLRCSL
jgi:hypothetical protein